MPEKKQPFEYVIKFGGSITEKGTILQIESIGKILSEIYSIKKNFIIIPGGGSFAEEVRRAQNKFHFSDEQAHWMAIYAMEQHALLLQHFIPNSKLIRFASKQFSNKKNELQGTQVPIFSVTDFMKSESKLSHDWNATSDAIATEIASKLNIRKIIFIKDVDGLYVGNSLVKEIKLQDLVILDDSPIDRVTPLILKNNQISAVIVNGFFPERVKDQLMGKKEIIGTKILV
ncbi:MAG: amino acid kinase family protein [Candidatus Heimdallarchaeota archaeon]